VHNLKSILKKFEPFGIVPLVFSESGCWGKFRGK